MLVPLQASTPTEESNVPEKISKRKHHLDLLFAHTNSWFYSIMYYTSHFLILHIFPPQRRIAACVHIFLLHHQCTRPIFFLPHTVPGPRISVRACARVCVRVCVCAITTRIFDMRKNSKVHWMRSMKQPAGMHTSVPLADMGSI